MADVLDELRVAVEKRLSDGKEFNTVVIDVVRKAYLESKSVIFGGDGYSEKWHKEAARRGLPNIKTSPEAFEAFLSREAEHLFASHKVYSARELEAIYHIEMENYIKQVEIEARIAKDMALTMFFPASATYAKELATSAQGMKSTLGSGSASVKTVTSVLNQVGRGLTSLQTEVTKLEKLLTAANKQSDIVKKGTGFLSVRKQTEAVRSVVDGLEETVADRYWPIPKYNEMLIGL